MADVAELLQNIVVIEPEAAVLLRFISSTDDDEAAVKAGCDAVRRLVTKGLLHPIKLKDGRRHYWVEEVRRFVREQTEEAMTG